LDAKRFLGGICQVLRRHYHHFLKAKHFLKEICQGCRQRHYFLEAKRFSSWRDLPGLKTALPPLPESKKFPNEICQDWRQRHCFLDAKRFLGGICQELRQHQLHFLTANHFRNKICQDWRQLHHHFLNATCDLPGLETAPLPLPECNISLTGSARTGDSSTTTS
jgi:hypothetical protein